MIQWLRGRLTGSYVGEPSTLPLPSGSAGERRYRPRVFRAAVRDVQLIASPPDARPPRVESATSPDEATTAASEALELAPPAAAVSLSEHVDFRQPRIDEAHVTDIRGSGTFFLGALFDVRVTDLKLSYPTEKAGRAYGLMTGTVTACLVLPPLPAPERVPESKLIESAGTPLLPGELHIAPSAAASTAADEQELSAIASETAVLPEPAHAAVALVPWLALVAAVCLLLALACGALPATLWALFMLPTVVARRLFSVMLPDTRGIHVASAMLVMIQLACAGSLLHIWWASGCRELAILPLLGVIAVLFPAGLMPSPIPLAINAASLSLILFGWGSDDGSCAEVTSMAYQPWSASALMDCDIAALRHEAAYGAAALEHVSDDEGDEQNDQRPERPG